MSSILDALRKVEEGRGRRRLPPSDPFGFATPPGPPPQKSGAKRYLTALVVLVAAGGGVLTGFVLNRSIDQGKGVDGSPPSPVRQSPVVSPPGSVVSVDERRRDAPLPSGKTEKSAPPAPARPLNSLQVPAKAERVTPPQPPPAGEDRAAVRMAPEPPAAAPHPPVRQPAATVRSEKGYRVSGIGWQKDASARYAVINGTAVTEGGSVDGARVVEIQQDRVLIEENGATREVYLGR